MKNKKIVAIISILASILAVVIISTVVFNVMFLKAEKERSVNDTISLVDQQIDLLMWKYGGDINKEKFKKEDAYYYIMSGGPTSLNYMLSEFKNGNGEGVRGDIMMYACRDLLGEADKVKGEVKHGADWYKMYIGIEEVKLDDFKYSGDDAVIKLIYENANKIDLDDEGLLVSGVQVYKSVEEESSLKVFARILNSRVKVYKDKEKFLTQEVSGVWTTCAMTFKKGDNGEYKFEKIETAEEGKKYEPSVKAFCVTPVTNKEISGLATKIIDDRDKLGICNERLNKNLKEHLSKNGIKEFRPYDS